MSSAAMRYVLIGDGLSPHLAKWARALAPRVELWVVSSTSFLPAITARVPPARRLALATRPDAAGGNLGVLWQLPRLTRWLRDVDADWINPHYLSSHGTLAWAAKRLGRLRGRLLASAWGSDVLVAPERHAAYRWALRRVLHCADLATSDSQHMAERMRSHGCGDVLVFPFGLDDMPPPPPAKQPWLVYANRGLEPIYRPLDLLAWFQRLASQQPEAQLVVANDGSLRASLETWVREQGLGDMVRFVGRLDAAAQASWYERAQWFASLPASDSVSVSVIEAMAQGCLPVLSDLPANRELVRHGDNGLILAAGQGAALPDMQRLLERAEAIGACNRTWVMQHGLFEPCIDRLLARLGEP